MKTRVPRTRAAILPAAVALVGAAWLGALPAGAAEPVSPTTATLRLRMGYKNQIYVYAPPAAPKPGSRAIIFFSSYWGWRPLHQETAAHIAAGGHWVIGIDSTSYFDKRLDNLDWGRDLTTLREFANGRAGLPKDTPVILMGHSWGAELIPYMINRGGAQRIAGALLVGPSDRSAFIYRVSLQMKNVPSPPDEAFDVAPEVRALAPMPVVMIEGAADTQSRARDLVELLRGPHKFVSIPGGDKQFDEIRDTFLGFVDRSLDWIEGPR